VSSTVGRTDMGNGTKTLQNRRRAGVAATLQFVAGGQLGRLVGHLRYFGMLAAAARAPRADSSLSVVEGREKLGEPLASALAHNGLDEAVAARRAFAARRPRNDRGRTGSFDHDRYDTSASAGAPSRGCSVRRLFAQECGARADRRGDGGLITGALSRFQRMARGRGGSTAFAGAGRRRCRAADGAEGTSRRAAEQAGRVFNLVGARRCRMAAQG
jgi:hypothetical protein